MAFNGSTSLFVYQRIYTEGQKMLDLNVTVNLSRILADQSITVENC